MTETQRAHYRIRESSATYSTLSLWAARALSAETHSGNRYLVLVEERPREYLRVTRDGTAAVSQRPQSEELRGWLAVAESAFSFWDNDEDAEYDDL